MINILITAVFWFVISLIVSLFLGRFIGFDRPLDD